MLDIYTHCSQIQGRIPDWEGNFGEPDIKTAWEIVFPREEHLRPYGRRNGDGLLAYSARSSAAVFRPGCHLDAGVSADRYHQSSRKRNAGGGVLQENS